MIYLFLLRYQLICKGLRKLHLSFLDIPHKPSVQWPMLACAAGTVLALLVTSVGMAMNNSIVVGGGALYLFSGETFILSNLVSQEV